MKITFIDMEMNQNVYVNKSRCARTRFETEQQSIENRLVFKHVVLYEKKQRF